MNIKIKRDKEFVDYEVSKGLTLLKALYKIKSDIDNSLGFKAGCRSGICGVCAVRVNEKEVLACSYKPKDDDEVTPLRYHSVIKDLIVDKSKSKETLKNSLAWLHQYIKTDITIEEEKKTELQSDCILCSSCYSACPVFEINKDFLGPFALTRVYRYTADKREGDIKSTIDTIQSNGVWDCTLCGECTTVCPQGIDPKMDITLLRGVSSQFGYSDPNFVAMSFGF